MSSPNEVLMKRYGTEAVYLEKQAGSLPLAARIAAGIVGLGVAHGYKRDQQQQALQARAMNDQFRLLLAMRMDPALMGMEHTRVPVLLPAGNGMPLGLTEGMVRMASDMGADLAQMEKDAGIGAAFGAVSGAAKAIPAFMRGASKGMGSVVMGSKGTGGATALQSFGNALGYGARKGYSSAAGTFNKSVAAGRASDQARRVARQGAAEVSAGTRATATTTRSSATKPIGRVAPAPTPEAPPPAATPAPMAPTPPPAAPPTGGQAPGMVERAGMANGAWKWKVPAIGAMALGGYGVYRGGKGAINALGRESPPSVYNAGGVNSASGINQYGVPDRATSFS